MPQRWRKPFHSLGRRMNMVLRSRVPVRSRMGTESGITYFLVYDDACAVVESPPQKNAVCKACTGTVYDPYASIYFRRRISGRNASLCEENAYLQMPTHLLLAAKSVLSISLATAPKTLIVVLP